MDGGIAVDFRGRSLKDPGFDPLGQAEAIDRTHHGCFGRLDRIVLVVGRRGRAGQVVNAVDLEFERVNNIMADQFEARMTEKMFDVLFAPGEKIVHTKDVMLLGNEAVAKVRPEKPSPPGDKNSHDACFSDHGRFANGKNLEA
jgi:hypothetical protein